MTLLDGDFAVSAGDSSEPTHAEAEAHSGVGVTSEPTSGAQPQTLCLVDLLPTAYHVADSEDSDDETTQTGEVLALNIRIIEATGESKGA